MLESLGLAFSLELLVKGRKALCVGGIYLEFLAKVQVITQPFEEMWAQLPSHVPYGEKRAVTLLNFRGLSGA
jgi:hypothetical protein